jgi:SNF2 family DNA or RNA helicase
LNQISGWPGVESNIWGGPGHESNIWMAWGCIEYLGVDSDGQQKPVGYKLGCAGTALAASCHPMLSSPMAKSAERGVAGARAERLTSIANNGQATNSSRIRAFLGLFRDLREQYTTERVLVFSQWVTFLNLVELALQERFGTSSPLGCHQ